MNTISNYIIVPNEARESLRQFNSIFVDVDGVLLLFLSTVGTRVFLPDREEPLRVIGEAVDRRGFYAVCELPEEEKDMRCRRIAARTPVGASN